ncbi:FecR family protein [Thermoflavifilum aggregans]|uniref:FecR family protein n=1 Tax=Thermoflavifilum aggregans TaxID=454188 RepID=A0A2M9CVV8_9BACT|nr:FecR domain-containing protein [Thermoflavifilum aggregans]PJJ76051.1 FecR family protein [Thermoflavifilum aggregans]
MDESIWELIVKMFSEGLDAEEQDRLQQWFLEHPESWIKSGILQKARLVLIHNLEEERQQAMIAKVKQRIQEEAAAESAVLQDTSAGSFWHKSKTLVLGMLVAVLIIGAGITWWVHNQGNRHSAEVVWKTISTAPGVKSMISLPDGSTIWLNAATTLKYPEAFSDSMREVYLTGEAYFKIVHRTHQPFVIHTREMDIRDLGTEFNVRAYPDEDFTETVLISGAVAIKLHEQQGKEQLIYLKPDQKLIFRRRYAETPAVPASSQKPLKTFPVQEQEQVKLAPLQPLADHLIPEIAWKDNRLVFEDESFVDLAQRLQRWYGIPFHIESEELAHQRFTGRADNVSLTQLLQILQKIKPFRYQITDTAVFIQSFTP